jgi:hypothetical protein
MSCTGRALAPEAGAAASVAGRQTKNAPRGPCTSSWSPTRTSSTRNGDTSPSGSSSTASTTRVDGPDEAIEYERVAV